MTEPHAPAAPVRVTLADQIIEVEKTVRDRARRYPDQVSKGRLLPATADHKLAALRAVQSTLVWLEQNEAWIRPAFEERCRAERQKAADAALLDEIHQQPAVQRVLELFPGADVGLPADPGLPKDPIADAATSDLHDPAEVAA